MNVFGNTMNSNLKEARNLEVLITRHYILLAVNWREGRMYDIRSISECL